MTEDEIAQMKADIAKQKNEFGRWQWFAMIERLANGDITKFDEVCKQNFISCLNLLSYWKEKDAKIAQLQEQNNRQINTIK